MMVTHVDCYHLGTVADDESQALRQQQLVNSATANVILHHHDNHYQGTATSGLPHTHHCGLYLQRNAATVLRGCYAVSSPCSFWFSHWLGCRSPGCPMPLSTAKRTLQSGIDANAHRVIPHVPHGSHGSIGNKRQCLFSKFDQGIHLDDDGWFSITPVATSGSFLGYVFLICQFHQNYVVWAREMEGRLLKQMECRQHQRYDQNKCHLG